MTLGKFIEQFSHNNLIRLVYNTKGGHEVVMPSWDIVTMDWEVNKQRGDFRHYINNEVLGIASICFGGDCKYPEAINIVIERLENQPILGELVSDECCNTECYNS